MKEIRNNGNRKKHEEKKITKLVTNSEKKKIIIKINLLTLMRNVKYYLPNSLYKTLQSSWLLDQNF